MRYRLLDRFRSLFDGKRYLHRNSSLGDSVAWCLPEDLYALHRSPKLNAGVDAQTRVLNVENKLRGIKARRGDGTFGELIPHAAVAVVPEFKGHKHPIQEAAEAERPLLTRVAPHFDEFLVLRFKATNENPYLFD